MTPEITAFVAEQRELCENPPRGPWTEAKAFNDMTLPERRLDALKRWAETVRSSLPRALDIIEQQAKQIAELERESPREYSLAWPLNEIGEVMRSPTCSLEMARLTLKRWQPGWHLESRTAAGEWRRDDA